MSLIVFVVLVGVGAVEADAHAEAVVVVAAPAAFAGVAVDFLVAIQRLFEGRERDFLFDLLIRGLVVLIVILFVVVIGIVEDLDRTSEDLELLSKIESDIVNCTSGSIDLNGMMIDSLGVSYKTYLTNPENPDPASGVVPGMGLTDVPDAADSASEQLITDIEAKMDSLNSFSQQTMIDLQSLTAKRDQSYDMISNILKSLNTTLLANVNNM